MDALRKAKLIDEAAISVQWLDHYFYYASIILCAPAAPESPVGSGHPDTHRARTGSTWRLGALAVRHTGGRDAVWHGPPGTGAVAVPKAHQAA